jgi:pseudaminic acid synthase
MKCNVSHSVSIAGRRIARSAPPYIIAELSANHNGSLETAIKLISEAKKAGVDAIKIQTYSPDTITLNCESDDFIIDSGLWQGKSLYKLYQEAHMPWEWHRPLFRHAREIGITIFSSPFDQTAVDYLEELDVPAYKIASFELVDLPLIKYVARTGKPLILSTGMAEANEIAEAIESARSAGCGEIAILRCVSGYPAPPAEYNLLTLTDMTERFGLVTGLSDHTIGNATAVASIALGGCIIEKHFTLDRNAGGPDDSFSVEPDEMARLCEEARSAWEALGSVQYGKRLSEIENVKFRRSLYFVKALNRGETVSKDAIRSVRPGYGLHPKYFDQIIGRKVLCDVSYGTPVGFENTDLRIG